MAVSLLIIRTPLQAKLAEIALNQEGVIEYDLLYLTQRKTEKTVWYFNRLAEKARRNSLVLVPEWFFSGLAELTFYFWARFLAQLWGCKYKLAIFGSLDSPAITGLATRFANQHVTVDDGSANIARGTQGYFVQRRGFRERILKKLTGAPDLIELKKSIAKHYTLFSDYPNAIEAKKLVQISKWPPTRIRDSRLNPIVVFIGTAEHLWMTPPQIEAARSYLKATRIDFYIPHPMEKRGLLEGVAKLPHSELLAEDALVRMPTKRPIHLIAVASTVLFTAKEIATHRIMLVPHGCENLASMAQKSGCEIVSLGV